MSVDEKSLLTEKASRDALNSALRSRRDLVHEGLAAAIATLGTEIEPIAAYHFGWRDADGRPTRADSGKGLRGCLALLSAEAAGAGPEAGLAAAVAVELVHNFSLLHDDVIDLDKERRHRPTAWTIYGIGPVIVVGDALLTLAVGTLLSSGRATAPEATRALLTATHRMIEGQSVDLSYAVRREVTVEEVLEMSALKTGALIGCAASIGAILAGADETVSAALLEFGTRMGIGFQAVDDILGAWGDPTVTGKDVGSDIGRRKLTLPLAMALGHDSPAAEELRAIMSIPTDLETWHVKRATELVEQCGGREWAESVAAEQLRLARAALDSLGRPSPAVRLLENIAEFAMGRAY